VALLYGHSEKLCGYEPSSLLLTVYRHSDVVNLFERPRCTSEALCNTSITYTSSFSPTGNHKISNHTTLNLRHLISLPPNSFSNQQTRTKQNSEPCSPTTSQSALNARRPAIQPRRLRAARLPVSKSQSPIFETPTLPLPKPVRTSTKLTTRLPRPCLGCAIRCQTPTPRLAHQILQRVHLSPHLQMRLTTKLRRSCSTCIIRCQIPTPRSVHRTLRRIHLPLRLRTARSLCKRHIAWKASGIKNYDEYLAWKNDRVDVD
jgi:hypothetical protein